MQTKEPVSNLQPVDPASQQLSGDSSLPIEESIQEKKSNRWLIIGLVVLILTAIGVTGFFAYKNYLLKKQVEKQSSKPIEVLQTTPSSTRSTPSPIPTIDPTAGWKTYINEEYNFSFDYPSYLEDPVRTPDTGFIYTEYFNHEDTNDSLNIGILSKTGMRFPSAFDSNMADIPELQLMTQSGVVGIRSNSTHDRYAVDFRENENAYVISLWCVIRSSTIKTPVEESIPLGRDCDTIFSTFKFTD